MSGCLTIVGAAAAGALIAAAAWVLLDRAATPC